MVAQGARAVLAPAVAMTTEEDIEMGLVDPMVPEMVVRLFKSILPIEPANLESAEALPLVARQSGITWRRMEVIKHECQKWRRRFSERIRRDKNQ